MTQYAYFHMNDNTIAEMEVDSRGLADGFANTNDAYVIGLFNYPWNDSKWEAEYARLERYGYFTAERQEELFDTPIAGTLDRLNVPSDAPLEDWERELMGN